MIDRHDRALHQRLRRWGAVFQRRERGRQGGLGEVGRLHLSQERAASVDGQALVLGEGGPDLLAQRQGAAGRRVLKLGGAAEVLSLILREGEPFDQARDARERHAAVPGQHPAHVRPGETRIRGEVRHQILGVALGLSGAPRVQVVRRDRERSGVG